MGINPEEVMSKRGRRAVLKFKQVQNKHVCSWDPCGSCKENIETGLIRTRNFTGLRHRWREGKDGDTIGEEEEYSLLKLVTVAVGESKLRLTSLMLMFLHGHRFYRTCSSEE